MAISLYRSVPEPTVVLIWRKEKENRRAEGRRIQGTRKRRKEMGECKEKREEGNETEETNKLGREAVGEVEDGREGEEEKLKERKKLNIEEKWKGK